MKKEILVETSARHVHVTKEALEILFGEGYELTKKKDLSQPGQFASNEKVAVVGTKSQFPAVSILGPVRPECQVELAEGVIAAQRHIHATPEDAEKYGLEDKQIVSVKIDSDGRKLIFDDVVVRVSPKYAWAMHIDTDESNAASAKPGMMGEIL